MLEGSQTAVVGDGHLLTWWQEDVEECSGGCAEVRQGEGEEEGGGGGAATSGEAEHSEGYHLWWGWCWRWWCCICYICVFYVIYEIVWDSRLKYIPQLFR